MNYVSKNAQKVCVSSRQDAIALIQALNENGCTDSVSRQEIIGKKATTAFKVKFELGETEIGVCSLEDGETILHWLLNLGVNEVTIRRSGGSDA